MSENKKRLLKIDKSPVLNQMNTIIADKLNYMKAMYSLIILTVPRFIFLGDRCCCILFLTAQPRWLIVYP